MPREEKSRILIRPLSDFLNLVVVYRLGSGLLHPLYEAGEHVIPFTVVRGLTLVVPIRILVRDCCGT